MYKVLIADDEIKVCQLIESLVDWEKMDLQLVSMVHNGLEAVKAVEESAPDIVIADIRMPELDGLSLLRRIKEAKRDINFLIVSGYRNFEYVRDALQNEAEDYLLKPIRRAELNEALKKIIEKRNRKQEISRNVSSLRQGGFVRELLEHQTEEDYPVSYEKVNEEFHCTFSGGTVTAFAVKMDIWTSQNLTENLSVLGKRAMQIIRREMEKNGFWPYMAVKKDLILCIVEGADIQSENFKNGLRHIIRNIHAVSDQTMKVRAAIGAGGSGQFRDLYRLSFQAQKLVWDRLWLERADIIFAGGDERDGSVHEFFSYGMQRDFKNAAECLNQEQVLAVMERVAEKYKGKQLSGQGWKLYEAYEKMFSMVGDMIRKIDPSAELADDYRTASIRLRMCGSLTEMHRFAKETVEHLFGEIRKNRELLNRKPVRDAKQYILQHFAEELTLEEVSSRAGLNPAYFSTVFKGETGQTFTEYLADIRIEKAKELLLQNEFSVSEVAWRVGYRDEKYFMRVFKKKVGLTAAKYRKLYG